MNVSINFTFHQLLIQIGATWWKTVIRFFLTKNGFLSLLASWLQSKGYEKSTAQASFLHLKIWLMCPPFCCKKHSRQITIPAWHLRDFPPNFAADQVANQQAQSLLLFKHTVDSLYLSVFWYTSVDFIQHSAACPDWFCWTSYVEIPVALVESECFRQVALLCVISLMNLELTDVLRTKWHWSVPKIMEIGWGILKMWAFRRCGLNFWANL